MKPDIIIPIIFLVLLGVGGFIIYFVFKQVQFVIQAVNLYKDMIRRQDVMIKLLKDIRGKGPVENNRGISTNVPKEQVGNTLIDSDKMLRPEKARHSRVDLRVCPSCNAFQDATKPECPNCGYDFSVEVQKD